MNLFRRVTILMAVLLLSCCWIYAQTSSHSGPQTTQIADQGHSAAPQSGSATGEAGYPNGVTSRDNGSAKNSNKVSVEGCLINSNGSYTLVDKGGQAWQLQGNASALRGHANQQVKISGKLLAGSAMNPAGIKSDATGGSTGTSTTNGEPRNGTIGPGNTTTGASTRVQRTGNVLAVHKVQKTGGSCNAEVPGTAH
jgi:hypothetical protein